MYLKRQMASILSLEHWKETSAFKAPLPESPTNYYKRMGAQPEVLKLVELQAKSFGTRCEKIIIEIFNIEKKINKKDTQYDGTLNGIKIEIKCAKRWAGGDGCEWQHLKEGHDFQYLLGCMLDTDGTWKVWCVSKELIMGEMRTNGIVKSRGTEGLYFEKNKALAYLTPIQSREDLLRAISVQ
jgi:hypothetical protein